MKKYRPFYFSVGYWLLFLLFGASSIGYSQVPAIKNNASAKRIEFGNGKISMTLDYKDKVAISRMVVNGQEIINGDAGVYSSIRTADAAYSSLQLKSQPLVKMGLNTITVAGIVYGDINLSIKETWTFFISNSTIRFRVDRVLPKTILAEQQGSPVFTFKNMETWEGAYQDYGGLAWFYLFNKKRDTYGVHSSASRFWNSKTGNGLLIQAKSAGRQVAMDYSRTPEDKLAYRIVFSRGEMPLRFDSGTNRRRFLRDRSDVWAPVELAAGKTSETLTLSYFDYAKESDRGNLRGINGSQVKAVLNTIARIGVIDKQHFGGNSWHTPYGPICLHEQYIAAMGLAINDKNYLNGYQDCLDFYRDHAIKKDGRVWARWAYSNEDMMAGEVNSCGFYEAQWGYLLDANPDFVTNVSELYDQTGNLAWIKSQSAACEKALDWIINRDRNGNGLVEMMTDSHTRKKGSDWIDIIWASYENAFVNAKLYHALVLWAAIEKQLGNTEREKYYEQFAVKLKTSFNKSTGHGGFWDEEKKCYAHWRDKDGSIHGNNMVTPVNFMAIAYGICGDETRKKTILDDIEEQMQKEKLFFWPICLYSYGAGEGNDWQFPFPEYENGDIFLSWGSVAVKAYAAYKPELALKYVRNVLEQYAKDGLAFQRYGRKKQDGRGDDILSGNSLAVVGLYQSVYGINPRYNRFYLDPHITEELAGTQVKYHYRDQPLTIDLEMHNYAVSNIRFTIRCANDFGFSGDGNKLLFFNGADELPSLILETAPAVRATIAIKAWGKDKMVWLHRSSVKGLDRAVYQVKNLVTGHYYTVLINGRLLTRIKSLHGSIRFTVPAGSPEGEMVVLDNGK